MAHSPDAIRECDMLLVIENGGLRKFGPKDQVLKEMVTNHEEIANASGKGAGVS